MSDNTDDKKPSWQQIQSDLKSALDTWTEISAKAKHRKTPEEEQLEEIRKLLGNLQEKIKHFDEDDTTGPVGTA